MARLGERGLDGSSDTLYRKAMPPVPHPKVGPFLSVLALMLTTSVDTSAAPIAFSSTKDGNWRGAPPPLPWAQISGGNDHDFPISGDTATISGHTISLSVDESCAALQLTAGNIVFNGFTLAITGSGSWTEGQLSGQGILRLEGAEFSLLGSTTKSAAATIRNLGMIRHVGGGSLEIAPGALIENVGVYEFQTDASVVGDNDLPSLFNNSGVVAKTGGGGDASIGEGITLNNTGTIEARSGRLQITATIVQADGDALIGGTWRAFTNATLDLGAVSLITNAASITLDGAGARLPNTAGILENRGRFLVLHGADYLNSGPLINSGFLFVGAGSPFTINGDLTQTDAGELASDADLNVMLTSSGRVTPRGQDTNAPGILSLDEYTQLRGGILEIPIGGSASGSQYSRLEVGGMAVLDGSLQVRLVNGFVPRLGDRFRVLNCGMRSGEFAGYIGTMASPQVYLQPHYDSMGLTLLAINRDVALQNLHGSGVDFGFSFATVTGGTYLVEYSLSLSNPDWQLLTTVTGDGSRVQVSDDFLIEPQRFYRIRLQ
jgi:hypothetical protein